MHYTPLQELQIKIGVKPDNSVGPKTLKAIADYFKLSNEQVSHFCGQCAHETGVYKLFSENLNYSIRGLQKTFGKYFPGTLEESYAHNPEKIPSRVYGNRMGNGDEESKDGWKYRGRGALQLTGKGNYEAFAKHLAKPEIISNPDLVATMYAFESAIYFFDKNKLWAVCDRGINDAAILSLTKKINGGTNGYDHRKELTYKYFAYLK